MASENATARKRGPNILSQDEHSYLPDFLQDSPYLPLGLDIDDTPLPPYRKPTIRQIFKSKRIRDIFTTIVLIVVGLLFLKSVRRKFSDYWNAGPTCLSTQTIYPSQRYLLDETIDWSLYAYAQYATNIEYLCNSIMVFEALHRLGSKAERLLMYPESFELDNLSGSSLLLRKARDEYNVKLRPVEIQHRNNAYHVWADSYTKLLAFDQIQYERILILDSDSTILKHMDEMFFLPRTTIAVPRAYWLDRPVISSHIMLIQPSTTTFKRVEKAIKNADGTVYDMEIVNKLFGDSCVVLPHRWYGLLTGEFRRDHHRQFLEQNEKWDPEKVIKEAKFVHFSDDPFPKPWHQTTGHEVEQAKPKCAADSKGVADCRARDIWLDLYTDFKDRRKSVCQVGKSPPVV